MRRATWIPAVLILACALSVVGAKALDAPSPQYEYRVFPAGEESYSPKASARLASETIDQATADGWKFVSVEWSGPGTAMVTCRRAKENPAQ